jgi:hypothetical protein
MADKTQTPFDVWRSRHFEFKTAFAQNESSFVKCLIPEIALGLNVFELFQILQSKIGTEKLSFALNYKNQVDSPVKEHSNSNWLKSVNMVGVNVRTIGNFFNLIKYLLTLSDSQQSIHILPIWEPGVVSSLYGKTSWNINPEFFSDELQSAIPDLDTPEKQLKVVTNLIHALHKTVGMDVIPHTDRFAEVTFLYPMFFEWVNRDKHEIVSVITENGHKVEDVIWSFLNTKGTANGSLISYSKELFFDPNCKLLNDSQKLEIIFGSVAHRELRLQRRLQLMQAVLYAGFETLPVTMAPPYRGLHLVEGDFIYDEMGNKWYNYQFDKPQGMSRVFGPLTRYKFYNTISNDSQELDFDSPNTAAWLYVCEKYYDCQKAYNFDFMRGDMAHVQPRAAGVPIEIPAFYDPLKNIKNYIKAKGVLYFGFFAETFLAPPNEMGYGNEIDHLEAIEADSTLGDLQGSVVGSNDFLTKLSTYIDCLETRKFAPNFTMITADKDDPRFDEFYKKGNHLRFFIGMFLQNMPSYMSLGFECRNLHLTRGANEEYSKLYVFQIRDEFQPDKVSHGPFVWGTNYSLFFEIEKLKTLADKILSEIKSDTIIWHIKPSIAETQMTWQYKNYVFVANLDAKKDINEEIFSKIPKSKELVYSSKNYSLDNECRIYRI